MWKCTFKNFDLRSSGEEQQMQARVSGIALFLPSLLPHTERNHTLKDDFDFY